MAYNVYVIELDPEVLSCSRFARANPDRQDDMPCVYVGSTALAPEERFKQHLAGHKANRYVFRYGVRLQPELYGNYLGFELRKEAEGAEAGLAALLRQRGYAVWSG